MCLKQYDISMPRLYYCCGQQYDVLICYGRVAACQQAVHYLCNVYLTPTDVDC